MSPTNNNSYLNDTQNSKYSPDRREVDRRGMDLS